MTTDNSQLPLVERLTDEKVCALCNGTMRVRDNIDALGYPETAPCPRCCDGTWAYEAMKRNRAAIAALQLSPMREALEACRAKFAEYVELHRAKFNQAESPCEYEDIKHKVARNQAMVRLCDAALSSGGDSKPRA